MFRFYTYHIALEISRKKEGIERLTQKKFPNMMFEKLQTCAYSGNIHRRRLYNIEKLFADSVN